MKTRTEHGWVAHFICGDRCRFRRNTHVGDGDAFVVVSTVGAMFIAGADSEQPKMTTIGAGGRYYETMVFWGKEEGGYPEADVTRQVPNGLPQAICADSPDDLPDDVDLRADQMHEAVVQWVWDNWNTLVEPPEPYEEPQR